MNRRSFVQALAAAGLLSATGAAVAQAYPERAVVAVVPYAAGGALSVFGQRLAAKIAPALGANMVIDPRGGAGGIIGTQYVARSKPDGYTVLLAATGSHIINPLTQAERPFDPLKDFIPIAVLTGQPMVLAVNPGVPADSVKAFIDLLKRNPGKYSYASAGTGALGHLTGELFRREAGNLSVVHVPYKGGGPALIDVMAGNVAYAWEVMSSVLPHHKSGKLKILSVGGEQRAAPLPDVPTAVQAGLDGLVSQTNQYLLAPAGTPAAAVEKLSSAVRQAMRDPEFQAQLRASGVEPLDSTPESTREFISRELSRWAPVVQAIGLRK